MKILFNKYSIFNCKEILKHSYHKVSKIFPPLTDDFILPKVSKKGRTPVQQLLHHQGIISNYQQGGLFAILPLGLRSLNKLVAIVENNLEQIDAQKILLPTLTSSNLWKQSGRFQTAGHEIIKVYDRHDHALILSPTHEESISHIISQHNIKLSHNHLPIKLYQTSTKFRDEARPKFGLIRAKEFIMNDLYTFDSSCEDALQTYKQVVIIYEKIFKLLNLDICKVMAPVGMIGGHMSHEFHMLTNLGDDKILRCLKCNTAFNYELEEQYSNNSESNCIHKFEELQGIEIGHTFYLGTRYSSVLSSTFKDKKGNNQPLEMGCFGIGITRLLGAALEVLSTDTKLKWPKGIEPYKIVIIPPKKGSKEATAQLLCEHLIYTINQMPKFNSDILVDDRIDLTIGARLRSARKMGYPLILVVGRTAMQTVPYFELYDESQGVKLELTQQGVLEYLS